MHVPAPVHAAVRGPLRERIRRAQSAHPSLAPRSQCGPPDFVGIGAQRCGTSWWHSLIEKHPRVAPLGLGAKELHFFDEGWREADAATLATPYATHFRRRPGQITGEWTPRYMFDPWVMPQLMTAAPEAKVLVMLRDPVARFVSGAGHALKSHPALTADLVSAAFARGMYGEQLARALRVVPRRQLLVLQLERCLAEPQHHLDRTFAFLGLDGIPVPAGGSRNAAVASTRLDPAMMDTVRWAYHEDSARLADLVPGAVDTSLWS